MMPGMHGLLDQLNDDQRAAVQHGEGPLLVIAGAGSGKTRVITRRVAWLLSQGVPEYAILGLTFTNKAAREMAARVEMLIPGAQIRMSTFHSACARFLRVSAPVIGYSSGFTIYDTQDRDQLLKSLMKDLDISPKEFSPGAVGGYISRLKNDGTSPDDFRPDLAVPLQGVVDRVYELYQKELVQLNAMDFDDLMLNFLRVLQESEGERDKYQRRFKHILVDEFQDTNTIQYRLVRLLAEHHGNLCVVGDPDQSIYSFRGAEIGNILSFPEDYDDTTVIKLETNYRSSATILKFAQDVISNNSYRHDKVLRPALGEGEPITYLPCATGREEAREIALQVRNLITLGAEPAQIAVFYRARFISRGLEMAFRDFELPYQVIGDVGFYERKEIKDLLAFLKVCVNPMDRVSLARILNVPPRGIGKVSEERFFEEVAGSGLAPGEFLRRGLEVPGVKGKAKKGLRELGELLDEAFDLSLDTVNAVFRLFLDKTKYLDWICSSGQRIDVEREENVRELLADARHFDEQLSLQREQEDRDVAAGFAYMAQVSLMTGSDDIGADNAVQMMTVHAAKGLEFDHVFVAGLEEGLFPHSQSLEDPDALEEERRLFYVASTRARQRLFCLRSELRENYEGGFLAKDPSRFLSEGGLLTKPKKKQLPSFEFQEEEEPPALDTDFPDGIQVAHATYGTGTVLRSFGRGRSMKVEVAFPSGTRILLVEYANLERVEEF